MAKLVTLHDADGEVIYPQSVWDENMIPDNTVTNNMIDWSSFDYTGANNSGNVQIGPLLVQWGRSSVYVPSGSPSESGSFTITFPKKFAFAPVANVQPEDIPGVCGEYAVVFGSTTTSFTGSLGHAVTADAGTRYFRWLAIGIAASN